MYLCLNAEYKKELGVTRNSFAMKVQLSTPTLLRAGREMVDERVLSLYAR